MNILLLKVTSQLVYLCYIHFSSLALSAVENYGIDQHSVTLPFRVRWHRPYESGRARRRENDRQETARRLRQCHLIVSHDTMSLIRHHAVLPLYITGIAVQLLWRWRRYEDPATVGHLCWQCAVRDTLWQTNTAPMHSQPLFQSNEMSATVVFILIYQTESRMEMTD